MFLAHFIHLLESLLNRDVDQDSEKEFRIRRLVGDEEDLLSHVSGKKSRPNRLIEQAMEPG